MTRPLRWTVVATAVPPGGSLGGIVRYTTELLRALAARDDVVVSAVTTRAAADSVRTLVDGDVSTVANLPAPMLSLLERHRPPPGPRPDVIHGVKHLLPRRSAALRVLTVHDMLLFDRPTDFGPAKRLLLPGVYRGSVRDADLLLCVSEATRRRVAAWAPEVVGRADVVRLAVSNALLDAVPRPTAGLAGRRFALVVGDPTPRKNLATLVSAWSGVRQQVPDAVLAVAGPPSWGRTELGARYDALVAEGAVHPLGHIDDAGLRWAYESAQVVLCPSLAEGFGLPAAEALAFGAPLIISDDAALREVAGHQALAVVPATDTARWTETVVRALAGAARTRSVPRGRSWAEVADESVEAVRRRLAAQAGRVSPRPAARHRSA